MHTTGCCVFSPITTRLISAGSRRAISSIFVFELPNLNLKLLLIEHHLLHHLVTLLFTLQPHDLLDF